MSELEVLFRLEGEDQRLVVGDVRGHEGISDLFGFSIELQAEEPIDVDACVGKAAALTLRTDGGERHVHGMICRAEHTDTTDHGAKHRFDLVPRAWLLDLGRDYRVFQGLSVPEIVKKVLDEQGISDVRMQLASSYAARDVVVQYRESDWAFLNRLLESEGIFYYFEHTADAHVLVVTDSATIHDEIDGAPLAFRTGSQAFAPSEGVSRFAFARQIRPSAVTVRDYPFENPRAAKDELADSGDDLAVRVFEFPATRAEARLAALRTARSVGTGDARSTRLVPGRIFTLSDHPHDAWNGKYLATRVEHQFEGGAVYRASFTCIPAVQPYRPELRTPIPRVIGAQPATVVGPEGTEIHVDEQGRVLVRFHWDHRGTGGIDSACWLPVAEFASGGGAGAVHVPRVDDPVLVEFIDGDPDRPLVTGRLYDAHHKQPYALPANKTRAVFRDQSTPGGGGYNELSFESAAGREEVYLRAQRDSRVEVQNDAKRSVGHDDTLVVDHDQRAEIGGERAHKIGKDESLAVGGARSAEIQGDDSLTIGGSLIAEVSGDASSRVEGDRVAIVVGSEKRETGGDQARLVAGGRSTEIGGDDSLMVAGNRIESVEGGLQQTIDGHAMISHGSLELTVCGDATLSFDGEVLAESQVAHKIGAPKIYISASSRLYLRAQDEIVLQVGDSKLSIQSDDIKITNGNSSKSLTGHKVKLNC